MFRLFDLTLSCSSSPTASSPLIAKNLVLFFFFFFLRKRNKTPKCITCKMANVVFLFQYQQFNQLAEEKLNQCPPLSSCLSFEPASLMTATATIPSRAQVGKGYQVGRYYTKRTRRTSHFALISLRCIKRKSCKITRRWLVKEKKKSM